jgi:hypothetical protein
MREQRPVPKRRSERSFFETEEEEEGGEDHDTWRIL